MMCSRRQLSLFCSGVLMCLALGVCCAQSGPSRERAVVDLSFDDATNFTLYDSSPYRQDAVLYGELRLVPGISGSGIRLAGKQEYLEVPSDERLDVSERFSLECWLYYTGDFSQDICMMAKDYFTRGWDLHLGTNKRLNLRVGGFQRPDHVSSPVIEREKWTHVVYTYDGGLKSKSLKLYVNGALDTAWDESGKVGVNDKPLVVTFEGILDNLRLYRDALNEAEVRAIFQSAPQARPAKSVLVERVWPRLLRYKPGETVQVEVAISSRAAAPLKVTYDIYVLSGLHARHQVKAGSAALAPNGRKEFVLDWKPGKVRFGCEVVCEVRDEAGRELLDRKGEVFFVARNPYQVGQKSGFALRSWEDALPERLARAVFDWRYDYLPLTEIMGIAPDNFSKWVPETDKWFAGQGSAAYRNSRELVLEVVRRCHEQGIAIVPYINSAISGVYGTEFARQHPEWVLYDQRGQFTGGVETRILELMQQFYRRYPESLEDKQLVQNLLKPDRGAGLQICAVNNAVKEAVQFSVERVIEGVKVFGFDGLRFDGHYQVAAASDPAALGVPQQCDYKGDPPVPDSQTADRLSARNTRMMKERIWREFPDFVFGYNWGHPYEKYGHTRPLDYAECAKDGGMILWESINHLYQPYSQWHLWKEAADTIADEVDHPKRYGGFLNVGWFHWWLASDVFGKHLFPIICAARAHLSGAGSPRIPRSYYRFAARYCGLLYDLNVNRAPEWAKRIELSQPRVWWRKYVYQRRQPDGSKQVIVHLLNPPVEEKVDIHTERVPEPVRHLVVKVGLEGGRKPTGIYWLSPDEPVQSQRLEFRSAGGQMIQVDVPDLKFWGVLVMEF